MALEQFLTHYGSLALFAGAALEGEMAVMLGGILVHRGVLGFAAAVTAAAMGSFLADQTLFFMGRYLRHWPSVARLRAKPLFDRVLRVCEGHPRLFAFGFRFVYGIRTISPLAMGVSQMPARLFVLANLAAAWVWALVFVSVGYAFGLAIQQALGRMHSLRYVLGLGAVLALVVVGLCIIVRYRAVRQKQKETRPT